MVYLLPGIVAFLLFYLYEIHTATGKFLILKPFFFLGTMLLLLSTGAAIAATAAAGAFSLWRLLVFGSLTLIFFALLLYALFFAIPFSKTYLQSKQTQEHKVCRSGIYALCRHPGVLCFAGFYLFLWLALGGKRLLWQLLVYTLLNLGYIVLQDFWSFPRCFADYRDYRAHTPFLIPNRESIRRCIETL